MSTIVDTDTGRRTPLYAEPLVDMWRGEDREPKIREYVRPSDALKCARALGYIAAGVEGEPMDAAGVFNTTLGNLLHREMQDAMQRWFAALQYLWMVEHGDELPEPGVPWRVEIELVFSEEPFEIPGFSVPIEGRADLVIYDAYDNVLEVGDYKSKAGYGFKKALGLMRGSAPEGGGLDAWVQSWIYAKLLGSPITAVVHIGKECIGLSIAKSAGFTMAHERFLTEYEKPTEELDEIGFAEVRRMWAVNQLVHAKGMLPKRTIPFEGSGTEIVAPGQNLFEDGTTTWRCDYCSFRATCVTDGPGRVPLPETSLLAIRNRERVSAVKEAFDVEDANVEEAHT